MPDTATGHIKHVKSDNVIQMHKVQIAVAVFAFVIALVLFTFDRNKDQMLAQKRSEIDSTGKKITEVQSGINHLTYVQKNLDVIKRTVPNLTGKKCMVSGLSNDILSQIIEILGTKTNTKLETSVQSADCQKVLPFVSFKSDSMKCNVITIQGLASKDGFVEKLNKYLRGAIPGFIINKSIKLKMLHSSDSSQQSSSNAASNSAEGKNNAVEIPRINLELQYYHIYFLGDASI